MDEGVSVRRSESSEYFFADFTEGHYRELLALVAERYTATDFMDFRKPGPVCLWRHDVDYSVHRAVALAQMEAEVGIKSTYFLNVHSEFYSAIGEQTAALVGEIIRLGHRIGLHFDAGFYAHKQLTRAECESVLQFERQILEHCFEVPIEVYSLHNPTLVTEWMIPDTIVAGMINAYAQEIQSTYTYVSDSNGWWQQRRLRHVLETAPEKLHVLTHPEWWQRQALSPRERISRCIQGRAEALQQYYDDFLLLEERINVGR